MSWDVGEYLDYGNCKCRKKLADKLVEECSENIAESELVKWLWKCMQFLYNIYCNICHCPFNNHRHLYCIFSFSLVLKKR